MKVYLAGPMRGKPYYNFLQFDAWKAVLTMKGLDVVSPADIDRKCGLDPFKSMTKGFPKRVETFLLRDIKAIADVDAVVVMPKSMKSKGVMVELAAAIFLNKPIYQLK